MNLNLKINNKTFIFILIIIVLLSLFISCQNSNILEGHTNNNDCSTYNTVGLLEKLKNNKTYYEYANPNNLYDFSINEAQDGSYNFTLTSSTSSSTQANLDISGVINSDLDTITSYTINGNQPAYPEDVSFICPYDILTLDNVTLVSSKYSVNRDSNDTDSGNSSSPVLGSGSASGALAVTDNTTSNSSSLANSTNTNVNVDVGGNPSTTSLSPGTTTNNIINPTSGIFTPGQTFVNPSLAMQPPVNSILTTQPTGFIDTVQNGFDSLFGMGTTNTTLDINNLSDLNATGTTPSTLFTTPDGRQGIATPDNTINGIPSSQIPQGQEDLYILKSQVVPPVCPACPPVIVDKNTLNQDCPPCPPCARCPEPSFECKKVPNFNLGPQNTFLPRPVLNDFSTFGM